VLYAAPAVVEYSDTVQSIADCTEDILPLQDIGSYLKTRNLFRFGAFQSSDSSAYTTAYDESTDIQLDVSIASNGGIRVAARSTLVFLLKTG
jgi:hypothetical protein